MFGKKERLENEEKERKAREATDLLINKLVDGCEIVVERNHWNECRNGVPYIGLYAVIGVYENSVNTLYQLFDNSSNTFDVSNHIFTFEEFRKPYPDYKLIDVILNEAKS